MVDEDNNDLVLSEQEIRGWIGQELDSRMNGVAKKDDITSAISEAFKSLPGGGNSGGSSNFDEASFLDKVGSMIDERIAKKSSRNPGFLTRILAG